MSDNNNSLYLCVRIVDRNDPCKTSRNTKINGTHGRYFYYSRYNFFAHLTIKIIGFFSGIKMFTKGNRDAQRRYDEISLTIVNETNLSKSVYV